MALRGKVKWFDGRKGYGFISAEGKDYFVHFSEIKAEGYRTLVDEEEVEFEAVEIVPSWSEKGRHKAVNVVRINPPQKKERGERKPFKRKDEREGRRW